MRYKTLFIIVSMLFLTLFCYGCSPVNPVQKIMILPRPAGNVLPPGGWTVLTDPFPTDIFQVFQPEDEMLVGIKISGEINNPVIIDKITLLNKDSLEEVILSSDLGLYEPDQSFYIPYDVPDEQGTYQVTVYVGSKAAAKALFQVLNESEPPTDLDLNFMALYSYLGLSANNSCNSGIIVFRSNKSSESVNQGPPFSKAKIALMR